VRFALTLLKAIWWNVGRLRTYRAPKSALFFQAGPRVLASLSSVGPKPTRDRRFQSGGARGRSYDWRRAGQSGRRPLFRGKKTNELARPPDRTESGPLEESSRSRGPILKFEQWDGAAGNQKSYAAPWRQRGCPCPIALEVLSLESGSAKGPSRGLAGDIGTHGDAWARPRSDPAGPRFRVHPLSFKRQENPSHGRSYPRWPGPT